MRIERLAPGVADGVFEDRIHLDRLHDAAFGFDAVAHLQLLAEAAIRLARHVLPLQIDPRPARLGLRAPAFRAGQHDDLVGVLLDFRGAGRQHRLHRIAAPRRHARLGVRAADGLGNRPGRVLVRPHAADHANGVGAFEEGWCARIDGSFAHRVDHEFQRLLADAGDRVRVALFELGDAY